MATGVGNNLNRPKKNKLRTEKSKLKHKNTLLLILKDRIVPNENKYNILL